MLKSKKFKSQIAFEFFVSFSVLIMIFFVFVYLYTDNYKKLAEFVNYLNLENECYFLSSKFNSFLPIILRNISYYEIFDVKLSYEAEIKDYKITIGNLTCYTKIENVYGKLKSGKNIIFIENGNVSIFQV